MKWSALHDFMSVFVVTRHPAFAGLAQGYESGRVAVASRDTCGSARNRFFGRVSMANFRGCRFHMGPALTICCNLNTDAFVTNRPWRSMNMIVGCQTSNLSNSCQTKLPHRSFFHACQEHLPPTHPAVLETQRSQQPPLGITFARKRKNMKGKQRCCYGSWPVVVLRPADFGATSWDPVYMARIWEDSNIFESISLGVVFPKKKSCSLAHHDFASDCLIENKHILRQSVSSNHPLD